MYDTTPPPAVIEYAEAHGFTHGVKYRGTWNGYTIYIPDYSFIPDKLIIGLPSYILTKDEIIRWANNEERDEIMSIKKH